MSWSGTPYALGTWNSSGEPGASSVFRASRSANVRDTSVRVDAMPERTFDTTTGRAWLLTLNVAACAARLSVSMLWKKTPCVGVHSGFGSKQKSTRTLLAGRSGSFSQQEPLDVTDTVLEVAEPPGVVTTYDDRVTTLVDAGVPLIWKKGRT